MINAQLQTAASRDFAVYVYYFRSAYSVISLDGRKSWKNGFHCLATVRTYRAQKRECLTENNTVKK